MTTKKIKDHILFGRLGNKEQDIKYFKDYLPFENIKTVIEPFGGTFALSRNIYFDDKYKKIINDNDEEIYNIYKNPEEYSKFCIKMNEIAKKNLNDNNSVNNKKFIEEVENNNINNEKFYNYWKIEKIVRGTIIKILKNINHDKMLNLMKKMEFSNDNYMTVIEKYKNDKNAFIFLDPPYLFSDNSQYMQQKRKEGNDMTDIMIYLHELFNNKNVKCKMMLILNSMHITKWLFKDFIKGNYDKIYSVSKRKENLLIITNY